MRARGRPLRFLFLVLGSWIGARIWQLWPAPPLRDATPLAAGRVEHRDDRPAANTAFANIKATIVTGAIPYRSGAPSTRARLAEAALSFVIPPKPLTQWGIESPAPPPRKTFAVIADALSPPSAPPRRWSASGWAVMRGSGAGGGVSTPQLGGSQAGIRIARTLDAQGRVAIVARVAAALDVRQQEAALGIEWRPSALPVRLVAERRFGLSNQRGGTGLGLIGGVSDVALPLGFRLDGYAQAGAVLRREVDGYADGAARITRPVVGSPDRTHISLGLGVWGGAQREAQRLDIGPAATIDLPLGRAPHLRVALEWRQRIAGIARPGSGPALSIGTDY
jgi:hypothetical protein